MEPMAQVSELLTIKAEIFNRKTSMTRLRNIALELCDRLEIAEGGALIRACTKKLKD